MTRMTLTLAAASLTVTLIPQVTVANSHAPYVASSDVVAKLLQDGQRR